MRRARELRYYPIVARENYSSVALFNERTFHGFAKMSFPIDIKNCMKDCILDIFWPRKAIYEFFSSVGCTEQDLRRVKNFNEDNISRGMMVDMVFEDLSSRPDSGLGQFRSMLQSLTNWSHFDSYYFDKLKKLDREKAERCINHLKQLQEIRDAKAKEERQRREIVKAQQQSPQKTLEELRSLYLDLMQGKASKQKRGYELEKILLELAKLSGLTVTEPFRISGEQIDGTVKFEGEYYLIEAKWQDKAQSNEPLYQFAMKVQGRMYGRGMFVSVNGFSEYVVSGLINGKAKKTILVDGEDLILMLEDNLSFSELIDAKVKAAQADGLIYIHPITGKQKI
jgi:hypothetical protein